MTVQELIELLEKCDPDAKVVDVCDDDIEKVIDDGIYVQII